MSSLDLMRTPWIDTDIGPCTPAGALRRAKRMQWLRGDWDMATFCFLQALLQTAVVLNPEYCPDRPTWQTYMDASPEGLESWLEFDLGDMPWQCASADGTLPVSRLLPEVPGDRTLQKSSDISYWHEQVPLSMTLPQAMAALISDNLWGTRIGLGHRQGARGEQPLTTLLEPADQDATLWQKVWLNVMPADAWERHYGQDRIPFVFPWLQPLLDQEVTPENAHSLTILWQMPRRWRLQVDDDGLVRRVCRQSWGRHYSGWARRHPLTPYQLRNDGSWGAAKIGPHAGFDDWAAYALSARSGVEPAAVVREVLGQEWLDRPLRMRCCGWALGDGGATGSWVDNVMPFLLKGGQQARQVEVSLELVETHRKKLSIALGCARKDLRPLSDHAWSRLEPAFYQRMNADHWSDWDREVASEVRALYWHLTERHGIDTLIAAKGAAMLHG